MSVDLEAERGSHSAALAALAVTVACRQAGAGELADGGLATVALALAVKYATALAGW